MTLLPNLKISPGPNPVPRNQQHTQKLASKQWKKHHPGITGQNANAKMSSTEIPVQYVPPTFPKPYTQSQWNPSHLVSGSETR